MTQKDIDKIVWWVPFRKPRNIIRNILKAYYKIDQFDSSRLMSKIIFSNPTNIPIVKEFREKKIIVSLTTFPARDFQVDMAIYSLLMQSILPDKIILWLSYQEYPNGEDSIPDYIKVLRKYGVEILFCENMKPYNKLIPTLEKYPNDIIVTVDDDIYYQNNLLESLYKEYTKNQNCIHAYRAHKITFDENNKINQYSKWHGCVSYADTMPSYSNFATGVGGVLYPPHSLYKDIIKKDIFTRLSPLADDIWFWAMAVLNDTKINVVQNNINCMIDLGAYKDYPTLFSINGGQNKNDEQIKNVLEYYPEIMDKIIADIV